MNCFTVLYFCTVVVSGVPVFYHRLNDKKCGIEASSNLIHHNPWLVFLEFHGLDGDDSIELRCAGTLIDHYHVLTAAHCVYKRNKYRFVARLGEYDTSKRIDCVQDVCADPVVRIEVEKVIVHPQYIPRTYGNDIAILKLKNAAPYTDFIRPICLPSGPIEENEIVVAAGWGELVTSKRYSDIKKIIPLPLWSLVECRKRLHSIQLHDDIICAGGEKGMDTCRGDSGGPLMLVQERTELRAVVSSGHEQCGTEGIPALYTNVAYHLQWINAVRFGYYY